MEVPLLPEVGQLQDEAHCVICFLQAGQTLHRPHGIETLRTGQQSMLRALRSVSTTSKRLGPGPHMPQPSVMGSRALFWCF